MALAEQIRAALDDGREVRVPDHMIRLLEFLSPLTGERAGADADALDLPADSPTAGETHEPG